MKRALLALALLMVLPSMSYGVTYINSLPYTCNIPNETYVLASDLSTSGTGITIAASGVTINFNGKTLTFGTGNGYNVSGIEIRDVYHLTNISIYGGTIIHGATANPAGCNGIVFYRGVNGVTIHDMNVNVNSRADATYETCGIWLKWANRVNIYNCTINNQASEVVNRHSVPAVGIHAYLDNGASYCRIYNNVVNSTHQGINSGGATWRQVTSSDFKIYNNRVSINQCGSTNGYAILAAGINGLEINDNIINNITERGGRGIGVSYIDNFDIHNNTIISREGRTNESFQTNAIRSRWGVRYGKIRENVINIYSGQTSDFGASYGIYITETTADSSYLGKNVEVSNNTIKAITYDPSKKACGIYIEHLEKGTGYVFKDNVIETNSNPIILEADWNRAVNCEDVKFYRTMITKSSEGTGTFQTYHLTGSQGQVKDVYMLNTVYNGGASEDDVFIYSGLSYGALLFGTLPTITVREAQGNLVSGASIIVLDNTGQIIFGGQTNISGQIVPDIAYKRTTKAGSTNLDPHQVTANYGGKTARKLINVRTTSGVELVLGATASGPNPPSHLRIAN